VGDVLLIDRDAGPTAVQRSVIVFERGDGEIVAHRVFSVEADGFVTKGDANPTPDTSRVEPREVLGAGRLVVPVIGLPTVWAANRQFVPFGAWFVLIVAGLAHLVIVGANSLKSGHKSARAPAEMSITQQGIRRVRQLIAVLVLTQYVLDPSRLDVLGRDNLRLVVLIGAIVPLIGTNFLVSVIPKTSPLFSRLRFIELTIDTAVVVFFSTLTGTSGIGWVLFALPIIEAAVSFRLVGALTHWMLLTGITISGHIMTASLRSQSRMLQDLEEVLDQLSVLFLVVVPGAYLAEQLISDVLHQQRARDHALDRSAMLELVAEAGRKVAKLGSEHITAVVDGASQLGFDAVEVCMSDENGNWHRIDGRNANALPKPGKPASGLRAEDAWETGVVVVPSDPELSEAVGLHTHFLSGVIVETLSRNERARIVLRAGLKTGQPLTKAKLEAFRLIAGQAAVALDNDHLLAEVTAMHEVMEHKALHDHLTHLPNRSYLVNTLKAASEDSAAGYALLFLDLDGFKPVNDRLGHDAGDDLLRFVANRLKGAAPNDATVARIGGDEFAIMLPGQVTEHDAREVARDVWLRVSEPFEVGGDTVHISISAGIAFAEAGLSQTELIRRADVAMYRAKRDSATTYCQVYHESFDFSEERRARLAKMIPRALVAGQLQLAYQPIHWVDGANQMWGVEALIRWEDRTEGHIAPPDIIEAARSARILSELHRWIVLEACTRVAEWLKDFPDHPFYLTVNASPEELASRELVGNVANALQQSGLDASRLFVEISEQLVAPNVPRVVENMAGLQDIGVGLLLDDFGEGQTSLSYLHELPVAGIKLDRRLVVNTMRSETDRVVLRSVVELSHDLDLLVVAEGIEESAQLNVIAECGCNLAQGYLLSKPQPPEQIQAVLAETLQRGVDSDSDHLMAAPTPGGG
ncbi:MAG: EAL domain-containing protein, partial [Acidimicrobiia bacterium]|nr:EAL domain-containing protein [Acidimicrobiia bacterium]